MNVRRIVDEWFLWVSMIQPNGLRYHTERPGWGRVGWSGMATGNGLWGCALGGEGQTHSARTKADLDGG